MRRSAAAGNRSRRSCRKIGIFCSDGLLRVAVGLLFGIYIGINISGIYHLQVNQKDSTDLKKSSVSEQQEQELRELQVLKANAKSAEIEKAEALNKIHQLEESLEGCAALSNGGDTHDDTRNYEAENPNTHPICQQLSYPTPSAFSLWNHNINKVLNATRHPNDVRFRFHDFTAELLQMITPRLPRSVKSVPYEWDALERAMTVAWDRWKFMQLPPKQRENVKIPPRRLKILVMGGSLLVGTNCRKLLTELSLGQFMGLPKRDCNWAKRLGGFMDLYFGENVVEVDKVAMGGTNTKTGTIIFQYDLIPTAIQNPDIVINAYSTNDMHILTVLEAQSSNITLRDQVFKMTQDFVRHVMHSCDEGNRPPPLLLHVDDYLGNEQRKIWETTELAQGVQVLASYYGFTSFSYSDVVRDIVFGDTYESWLSADWWANGKFEREIHPGMGMHIASTWVTIYNMLNLVTTYCSLPTYSHPYSINEYKDGVLGLPPLRKDVVQAKGKPKPHPKGLPPVLTKDLQIEDVTSLWRQSEKEHLKCRAANDHGHHAAMKCPFSWVSGLSLQQNNETWINEYFRGQASTWKNWKLSNDGGKIGFIPLPQDPQKMVLDFSFSQTIGSVTMFYMKSYGPKWSNSEIRLSITSQSEDNTNGTVLEERSLLGFHGKNTSEMYTEEIKLADSLPAQTKFQVQATLARGKTFKIMGLAVCG